MTEEEEFANLLKSFYKKQEANKLSTPTEDITPDTKEIKKLLGKMEIYEEAMGYINNETKKYRSRLYLYAKSAAEDDGEIHIITKSHAVIARLMMNKKKVGLDLSDAFIGVGSLLAGVATPHFFDLFDSPTTVTKPWLLLWGIIGLILSCVGFMQKALK